VHRAVGSFAEVGPFGITLERAQIGIAHGAEGRREAALRHRRALSADLEFLEPVFIDSDAQRTVAVTMQSKSVSPSFLATASARFANPARCSARYSQSPDRSPVNMRPVRFAPCAAGARPTTRRRASGSPKPGTGRPQ